MTDWLTATLLVVAAVAGVVVAIQLVRDEPAQDRTFVLLGIVEAVVLVQLVYGVVALSTDPPSDRDVSGVLFVSYLVGNLLALPIGVFWSLAERTRAGTAVLLVAILTVVALQLRLETIWGGVA